MMLQEQHQTGGPSQTKGWMAATGHKCLHASNLGAKYAPLEKGTGAKMLRLCSYINCAFFFLD
jgi:hypothetical protein